MNCDLFEAPSIPAAPGAVSTTHPLLIRHADHTNLTHGYGHTIRTHRGRTARGHRHGGQSSSTQTVHIYHSGGNRTPSVPTILRWEKYTVMTFMRKNVSDALCASHDLRLGTLLLHYKVTVHHFMLVQSFIVVQHKLSSQHFECFSLWAFHLYRTSKSYCVYLASYLEISI